MDNLQSKKKKTDKKRDPIITEPDIPSLELFREKLLASSQIEKPVTDVYDIFDNDLARDNMENDLTAAEIEDLRHLWP